MMSSLWVSKKKKAELVELCDQLGLSTDGCLKGDIEGLLTEYLNSHASDLMGDSTFGAYYDTLRLRSPTKGSRSPTKVSNHTILVAPSYVPATRSKWRASRTLPEDSTDVSTGGEEESVSPAPSLTERTLRSGSRQLTAQTPRANRAVQDVKVPIPPSPAVVADAIESGANAIKDSAMKAVEKVSIQGKATDLRDRLSNVVSVNAVTLVYEAVFLLYRLIPFAYLVNIPAISAVGTVPYSLLLPDLFVLLTAGFWGPFLAWLTTAILVPLGNAYFFNLTATAASVARSKPYDPTISSSADEYKIDPLTFAVTKALVAYLAHYKGFNFLGLLGSESLKVVEAGVGRETQLIGAGIAGLAAVWESILRR